MIVIKVSDVCGKDSYEVTIFHKCNTTFLIRSNKLHVKI